jgi:hypothetical protein
MKQRDLKNPSCRRLSNLREEKTFRSSNDRRFSTELIRKIQREYRARTLKEPGEKGFYKKERLITTGTKHIKTDYERYTT